MRLPKGNIILLHEQQGLALFQKAFGTSQTLLASTFIKLKLEIVLPEFQNIVIKPCNDSLCEAVLLNLCQRSVYSLAPEFYYIIVQEFMLLC